MLAQFSKQPNGQLPPADILRKQVLERLILLRLEVAQAAQQGIRVSDQEVDAALGNVARQNNMTPDQLRANLAGQGVDFADFRESLHDEIAVQRQLGSTSRAPMRPEMGAAMVVKPSCTRAAFTCAASLCTAAVSWRTSAVCVSSCWRVAASSLMSSV